MHTRATALDDRLAVLAGDVVYEVRLSSGTVSPVGTFGADVVALGWGGQGIVGLSIVGLA